MQTAKRKAPIGLAAGIGARTTNNILERTEMNTSTHSADAAIHPALGGVPINYSELNPIEAKLVAAIRRADSEAKRFIVRFAESLASDPISARPAGGPSLRLVHGGAA